MRVGVIGAGPAGLTAALELQRGGASVDVFEASGCVGGLSRSLELWGQRVDIGPHRFFSTDERINRFWLDIVGDHYQMVNRLTRVYFRGQLIDYPIRPLSAMRKLGWLDATSCLTSYLKEKLKPSRIEGEGSFESWVTSRFGKRLFEMFFQSYSEKLWGIPCDQLSDDFAAQRIKNFSLGEAIASAVLPGRQKRHKTLVDQFAYPVGGTGAVYASMANQLQDLGGRIHLKSPVTKVVRDTCRVTGVQIDGGETIALDHVVSTMPLSLLVGALDAPDNPVPTAVQNAIESLRFRNTLLIYLHIDSDQVFDDQWVYIQSPDVSAGRVTNFRNWIPDLYGDQQTTVLAVERWCDSADPEWTADENDLIEHCSKELREIGLLESQKVLDGHVLRIARSYPIYEKGYQKHIDSVADYLSKIQGISPIGRNGAFKYNNQDHSILMGLLVAQNILHSANHDLWHVNSDSESYHERTIITETGLVHSDTATQ
ncbi:MAG: FAD-dependent oxidoreductase [Pirellulaceae bacterium]